MGHRSTDLLRTRYLNLPGVTGTTAYWKQVTKANVHRGAGLQSCFRESSLREREKRPAGRGEKSVLPMAKTRLRLG